MIISKTPYRISFFGGGTDLKQYYEHYDDAGVISTTIDKYCYISLRKLPKFFDHNNRVVYSKIELVNNFDEIKHRAIKAILKYMNVENGIELHHDGDLPARSGLGTSSAFCVGLLRSASIFMNKNFDKFSLASQAIHVEQNLLKDPVGLQDQIATSYGGFNNIQIKRNGKFDVQKVLIDNDKSSLLNSELLLFFTGIQRESNNIEKSKIKNIDSTIKNFEKIAKIKKSALRVIESKNFETKDFGQLLHESWLQKKKLSKLVSNDLIDEAYLHAKNEGAWGGKILGAGGGGFLLFLADKSKHKKIINDFSKNFTYVKFTFDTQGSKTLLEY